MFKQFKLLTGFELILWSLSAITVTLSFVLAPNKDYLSLTASLIGVTALIFVAKGLVFGQVLAVFFAVFYGIISYFFAYYGEMITYLGMSAPMALAAAIEWYRHPYQNSKEVKINKVTKKQVAVMCVLCVVVTIAFYFILKALNTTHLIISTISIATSFLASYLSFLRSPYYALAYTANDLVLIAMWILASFTNTSYIPMIFCFVMFLANDIYAYINWTKMMSMQKE